jgi:hypothetical protein
MQEKFVRPPIVMQASDKQVTRPYESPFFVIFKDALEIGGIDPDDVEKTSRLKIACRQMYTKVEAYIGYEPPDKLYSTIAEMAVTQISRFTNLEDQNLPLQRLSRGDYTVEYNTKNRTATGFVDVFGDYEYILKRYKKLRTL